MDGWIGSLCSHLRIIVLCSEKKLEHIKNCVVLREKLKNIIFQQPMQCVYPYFCNWLDSSRFPVLIMRSQIFKNKHERKKMLTLTTYVAYHHSLLR